MSGGHNDPERLAKWHLEQGPAGRRWSSASGQEGPALDPGRLRHAPHRASMPRSSRSCTSTRPLKEHTLLQAIARVNRTADGKDYGLVVDYWGVSEPSRRPWPSSPRPTSRAPWSPRWTSCPASRPGTRPPCGSSTRSRTRTTWTPAWRSWSRRTCAPSSTWRSGASASRWTCSCPTRGRCPYIRDLRLAREDPAWPPRPATATSRASTSPTAAPRSASSSRTPSSPTASRSWSRRSRSSPRSSTRSSTA